MIYTINDDTLPKTRRSIVTLAIISVVSYRYQPTITLTELGFFSTAADPRIEPWHFGIFIVGCLAYLLFRLSFFIPIYRHSIEKAYTEFFENLSKRHDELTRALNAKYAALNAIDRVLADEKLADLSKQRREMISEMTSLHDKVVEADGNLKTSIEWVQEHLNELQQNVKSIKGDSTEGEKDISNRELVERYREVLSPPHHLKNPFETIQNVLDRDRIDLSNIGVRSVASDHREIEKLVTAFLDGDFPSIDNFVDNAKKARISSAFEASIFTVWVPALLGGVGLGFGSSLIAQTNGYLWPIGLSLAYISATGILLNKFYSINKSTTYHFS